MTIEQWLNNDSLGIDIWKRKYCANNETLEEWFDRVSGHDPQLKELIKQKKFLFGGRTLANRGLNRGSYNNCYCSGRVKDSLEDIMQVAKNIALTYQAQGGQGLSLSDIRPKGAQISSGYPSDGIIPFMEIFNTVTQNVSQSNSRRGALMMSIDVEHPQVEDFITIKSTLDKINNANLSVEIGDTFMQKVQQYYDTGIESSYTIPNKFKGGNPDGYEVNPSKLYKLIMKHAHSNAEPGVMFMNRFSKYNLMEFVDDYVIHTSNPCGEQPLPASGACCLSSINISEYVINPYTEKAVIDLKQLDSDMYIYVKAMDDIVSEGSNLHALQEQREFALKYRNIGIGIMGLGDAFIKLGVKYGDEQSKCITHKLSEILFRAAVKASVRLAKERGTFPAYDERMWKSTIMTNHFSPEEIEEMKPFGLRNSSLLSVAPTGSIGTMLSISTGVEPWFAISYKRKTVSLHKDKEEYYDVLAPVVAECKANGGNMDAVVTSAEINWKDRIDIQAALQDGIDTAISSTINLPKETTVEEIEQLYLYAWQQGLKGVTIYRDGCRDGVLVKEAPVSISKCPKRPEILPAKLVRFKNGNENWIAFVGFLDDKPYEIFTGINDINEFPIPTNINEGQIIKVKDEFGKRYDFSYTDKYGYTIRLGGLSRIFNQEFWNYAKLISALLRGGIELDKVVKIIDGMHFDSQTLNTWKAGVIRTIKQFIKDGTISGATCPECKSNLVYTGGCTSCPSCGYSKCG